jgi:uncharacterized membrane protein
MKRQTSLIIIGIIIIITIISTLYLYESLPEQIPYHFNINGEVDQYASKLVGSFLLPIISILFSILFVLVPLIEPNKKNVKKFMKEYNIFAVIIIAFFAYLQYLILYVALGNPIEMNRYISPAIGILLFFIGIMLNKAKQNYSIGIRTPYTLASKKVWNKTHKLGSKLFKVSGILCLFGIIFPKLAFYFIIVPIIISTIAVFVYSYIEFEKED